MTRVLATAAAAVAIAVLLAVVPADAQSVAKVGLQRIDIRKMPDVEVFFTVVDQEHRALLGLAPSDLNVTLDGAPQRPLQLASALSAGEHLAVALLFDRSGSMTSGLDAAKDAARDVLSRMSESDKVAVIAFDDRATVQAPLSSDRAAAAAAIQSIARGRNTALYDAIAVALETLSSATTRRVAIVVFSDGKDTRSQVSRQDVTARARERGVPVYVLGLPVESDAGALRVLTDETGGRLLEAKSAADVRSLYQRVADQLENQYILRFRLAPGGEGRWHTLAVGLTTGAPTEREFLETLGPGVSSDRLAEFRRDVSTRGLARAAALGAIAGLLLGVALLGTVHMMNRGVAVVSASGAALLAAATGLGVIVGCLVMAGTR